ncbi:MAG: hypothetical protein BWK78_08035 [Thiotrichaceae bacterium IS1]|nr:MAG: hypothetical protein BWK78_08035 [Thiotrichaceae bacterium IS1]
MTLAEQISEVAKTLPMNQAGEVLDFIYSLQAKMAAKNSPTLAEEGKIIEGILARRNQRVAVSTDYLQQLRAKGRP